MTDLPGLLAMLPLDPYDPAPWPKVRAAEDNCVALGLSVSLFPSLFRRQIEVSVYDEQYGNAEAVLPLDAYLEAPQEVRDWMIATMIDGELERLMGAEA